MNKVLPIVCLLGILPALTGCGHQNPPAPPPPTSPTGGVPPPTGHTPVTPSPLPPRTGVIYTVDETHGTDTDNYLVAKSITFTNPQSPAREALAALLAAPHTPIPAGTKLNGVKIGDGLATVDFSRSPVDETHGEEKQSQALEAIQRTLGQFPDISRVQIEVNGQPLPSIGESGGGPMDVLRPGEKPQDSGGV